VAFIVLFYIVSQKYIKN